MNNPEPLFALLGQRWRIANELFKKPYTVAKLAKQLDLTPDQVSHHLQVMRRAGVVQFKRKNKLVTYRLTNSRAFMYLIENLKEMTEP